MVKYFKEAFAVAGDLNPIPNAPQPNGSISYTQGFPVNYQYPQGQPGSLDIPRDSTNQLFFDITSNIQQYQQNGTPFFITTADNEGTPYSYSIYATVLYDAGSGMRKYMSKKNNNTDLPTVTASWWLIDNTSNSIIYDNEQFDPSVNTGDVVYFDSTTSTFKKAIANGADQQNAIGIAKTEEKRVYSFGSYEFFSGLTPGSIYYLSTTTAGTITTVLPTSNVVEIGFSKSATEIFLNIKNLAYQSLAQNGYIYLPGGLLMQWGRINFPPPGSGQYTQNVSITFPITFSVDVFFETVNVRATPNTPPGIPNQYLDISMINITNSGAVLTVHANPLNPTGSSDATWSVWGV